MGLAWACLAIGEDGGVFAEHEIIDVSGGNFIEKKLLRGEFAKNSIETVTVLAIVDHCCVILVVIN